MSEVSESPKSNERRAVSEVNKPSKPCVKGGSGSTFKEKGIRPYSLSTKFPPLFPPFSHLSSSSSSSLSLTLPAFCFLPQPSNLHITPNGKQTPTNIRTPIFPPTPMSRTHPPNPQQAEEDKKPKPPGPTPSPPFTLSPDPQQENNTPREDEETEKEAKRKEELSRFLQYRARLEFVELMARRQQVEEEVEEEEEVEREGRGRNVGRVSELSGVGGLSAGGGGGGGRRRLAGALFRGAGVGKDRVDRREAGFPDRAILPPLQLETTPGFCEGGRGSRVEEEVEGLRERIGRLTEEVREMRTALEEGREQEQGTPSRILRSSSAGEGGTRLGVYAPSSPILSSLFPSQGKR